MIFTSILPAFMATLVLFCSAQPLEERQSSGNPFDLYAYGEGINGLKVFYADGLPPYLVPILGSLTYSLYRTGTNWRHVAVKCIQQSPYVW
jgi:hypothetical protein